MENVISIYRAGLDDVTLLMELSKETFKQSHGHSAAASDIEIYIQQAYNTATYTEELYQPEVYYHLITYNGAVAGYSKMVLNTALPDGTQHNLAKLDRLYLLNTYYNKKLGHQLMAFNLQLAKEHHQAGMWLYVWVENHRAVRFYQHYGFEVIGQHDFKLSENHANPNFRMFLTI